MAVKRGVRLVCTECKHINYLTTRNTKSVPEKLQLKKYCRFCRHTTIHKETNKK